VGGAALAHAAHQAIESKDLLACTGETGRANSGLQAMSIRPAAGLWGIGTVPGVVRTGAIHQVAEAGEFHKISRAADPQNDASADVPAARGGRLRNHGRIIVNTGLGIVWLPYQEAGRLEVGIGQLVAPARLV
jgi:hypothetical protein